MTSRLTVLCVIATSAVASAQGQGVPQNGYPIWQERMLQVLFNRTRVDPTFAGDPNSCGATAVRVPLMYVYNFNRAARFHSANLSKTGCFQHNSPCLLFSDISARYPPTGTCDGSASCACTNAAVCDANCTAANCTQTFARVPMFGTNAYGEIIAGGYGSPRAAHTGWMNSSGHCAIITGTDVTVGTGWLANTWTGDFGSGGGPSGTLIAGGHEVGTGFGQFTTSTAQPVGFRVNYYNAGGSPQSAMLNIDGTCTAMTLERGSATSGTYLATVSLTSASCAHYQFTFKDPGGTTVVLPQTGSYGVGASLAACPDYSATAPAACGTSNQPPTVATMAAATPNPVTGTTTALSVLGADDGTEGALIYTWAATGPAAVTYSLNGTNAAKSSTATFTRAGSYSFTVTIRDAQGLTVTSTVAVTVNATPTSVATTPGTASVQVLSTQQFSASARDQFGTALATQPTFTWSTSGGGTVNASGLYTAGSTPGGPFSVTATSGAIAGSAMVTVTAGTPPTVATAAAASPNPATGTTTALSVLGADNGGEAALLYTWAATGPAAVTYSANGTNAAKSSTATFTRAGSYSFTVTIRDASGLTVTSTVAVTVNATPTSIVVSPGTASVQVLNTVQLTASARDQFATALVTQPTFTWSTSGGGGSVSASGLYTAGSTPGGPFGVTATSGAISGSAMVTVTSGTPPTVATAAAASPNPVLGTTTALSVLGADDGGEAALLYTWAATGPAAVTYSVNGSNAAKSVTATFTRAGSYSFTVTIRDAAGLTATSTVTVTVNATLTGVAVSPASAQVVVSGTRSFSAQGSDQFGDVLATQPTWTWTVSGGGTLSAAGLFTAGSTPGGPFTVTAASGARSGTAQVTVTAGGPPTVATAAAASPNPVTGTTTALSVLGADDGTEAALTYTWAATGPAPVTFTSNGSNAAKAATATFTRAGSYTFTVTIRDAGGQMVTSTVTVTVAQTLTTVQVTPPTASTGLSGTLSFAASGRDQFANALASQPGFTWTVSGGGTISAAGLFTAGSTPGGPFTVTATSGSVSGTAQVSVVNGSGPTVATAAAASPNPVTGTTTALSVLGADDGGEAALLYTWSASGPAPVTFSANATNAAKASTATFSAAGSYLFTVTLRDAGGLTAVSTVTVIVQATPTAVSVTPGSANTVVGGTVSFAASSADQFGAALAPQPAFTWSVSGGGAIDTAGSFSANAAGGPFTVTATAGAISGTAQVTVSLSPDTTPPMVALTAPVDLATVSGQVQLAANATDDRGVANVEFLVDGASVGSSTSAPYGVSWNSTAAGAGSHRLSARATDTSGNIASSAEVQVTVPASGDTTPPTVAIATPVEGAVVRGHFTVTVTAADDVGVASVVLLLDGRQVATVTSAPYSAEIDAAPLTPGEHVLSARAFDAAGNQGQATPVRVVRGSGEKLDGVCGCNQSSALLGWLALAALVVRRKKGTGYFSGGRGSQ